MNTILTGCAVLISTIGLAQTPATETHASFAKSLGIYVFPAKDQDQATQDKDDADCYKWAVEQSGIDPLNPPKVEAAQVDTAPDGTAIAGAARGAAAGVAIGAIAGDAGKGAAIGAVAGGLAGSRAKVVGKAEQSGIDPLNPPKVEAAQVDTAPDGTAIAGAARGAAAGVAIGGIGGDAGKGGAIGAVAGGLAGRRAKVVGDAQQQQRNNQAAAQQQAAMTESFKKAFTVCLEGKGYTVK